MSDTVAFARERVWRDDLETLAALSEMEENVR